MGNDGFYSNTNSKLKHRRAQVQSVHSKGGQLGLARGLNILWSGGGVALPLGVDLVLLVVGVTRMAFAEPRAPNKTSYMHDIFDERALLEPDAIVVISWRGR